MRDATKQHANMHVMDVIKFLFCSIKNLLGLHVCMGLCVQKSGDYATMGATLAAAAGQLYLGVLNIRRVSGVLTRQHTRHHARHHARMPSVIACRYMHSAKALGSVDCM